MSIIRVYRYKIFSQEQNAFIDTNIVVYAPAEKIKQLGEKAQKIESAYLAAQ